MTNNVYRVTELVGTSEESISDAIQVAIAKANESLRNLEWFEVGQVRGRVTDGKAWFGQMLSTTTVFGVRPSKWRACRVTEPFSLPIFT